MPTHARPPRPFRWLPMLLPLLAACHSTDWREMPVGKLPLARVYDGVEAVAQSDGLTPAVGSCDRGLGRWQSRWRLTTLLLGHPGRFRLRVEIEDGGRSVEGWVVRWCVERQQVKDLRRSQGPEEDDWSDDGQDGEREAQFGERLRRQLQLDRPKAGAGDGK